MPAVSSDELHQKVLRLLPEGTQILSESTSVRPMVVRFPDGENACLFVWTLTAAGPGTGRPDEHKIQLKLPGQKQGERQRIEVADGFRSVILGYSSEFDVFACWEEKHYREFAFNRNVQIPNATVELASKEGWAIAPTRDLDSGSEVRFACKSERLYELLDASLDADNAGLAGDERAHFLQQRGVSADYRQSFRRSSPPGELSKVGIVEHAEGASTESLAGGAVSLNIRPRVGMYGSFRRLNYKPWFAIAELIDNALQSFLANRERLIAADGERRPLQIEVRIEDGMLRVSDRAAGIARADFPRAFSPAAPPADASGLSEFGIGLKAAACWFGDLWSVRTTALGEKLERTVVFDVPQIVNQGMEVLGVDERPAPVNDHYTVIEITKLHSAPKSGRTYAKIKEHIASIYRGFIRTGQLELKFVTGSSEEILMFEEPALLHEPYFKNLDGPVLEWRKDFAVVFDGGRRVWGWAGLLQTASTSMAGFAVLRRGRLIQGSGDETWRPERIFKKPNKYTYQRLVGELYVDGFHVSHTKDGIQWDEYEDRLLDELLLQLDAEPLPLIRQAEGHRVRKGSSRLEPGFGQSAVDTASHALEKRVAEVIEGELDTPLEEPLVSVDPPPPALKTFATRTFDIKLQGDSRTWRVAIEVIHDRTAEWLDVVRHGSDAVSVVENVTIRVNLDHPFSEQFINEDEASLGPVVRIVAALGLAEVVARESGTKYAGRVRRHLNKILRYALAEREGKTDTND